MTLRELNYICAVADFGHFGKAAHHCGVSQPTLSGQIKKLEAELGVVLFERDNKRVHLTEVGADIVRLARETVESVSAIKRTAETARDPYSGELRIGLIPTIAPFVIPEFSKGVDARHPNLKCLFCEDVTETLNTRLLNGELDFAVLATTPDNDRLTCRPLHSEPFWVITPDDHDLSNEVVVDVKDLPLDEMLLLSDGHCFRDQALEVCGMVQSRPDARVWATSLETLINLVSARQGITLTPDMSLRGGWMTDRGVSALRLAGTDAMRTINLTYRKTYANLSLIDAVADLLITHLKPETLGRN